MTHTGYGSIILFSLRSVAVLSGALLSGEAAKTRAKSAGTSFLSLLPPPPPPPISSLFLCPRPSSLLCAPNQKRHATQAMFNHGLEKDTVSRSLKIQRFTRGIFPT